MIKGKVSGLKWNLNKLRGPVLHFTLYINRKMVGFLQNISKCTKRCEGHQVLPNFFIDSLI